jgi:cytidylate kinase
MRPTMRAEEVLRRFVVTIDGPAGSGKSTTASILARRLGLTYLDTGAMYRAVTLAALERAIDPENGVELTKLAESVAITIEQRSGKPVVVLNGKDVETDIRTAAVSRCVSPVSRHLGVRRAMVRLQRRMGAAGGIVAEGRDTGSVVFPFAHVKIFLVAEIEARAERRLQQLRNIGISQNLPEIVENISARDAMDSGREASPLVRPAGAMLVDTSNLTIAGQVEVIEREVRAEAARMADLAVGNRERNPFGSMSLYYRISHAAVRFIFRAFFGLSVSGIEHARFRENFIFASNHLSYADPLVVGCALDREVLFLAKKELFRNRIFASLIRAYHAIPVDREEIERKTMRRILEMLGTGRSILMFPEGTRSRNGEIKEFKPGLGFTALNAGVSVVPVYVTGSNRLRDCLLRRARLVVKIGPPIRVRKDFASGDRKTDYRTLAAMAQHELRMLQDEAEA